MISCNPRSDGLMSRLHYDTVTEWQKDEQGVEAHGEKSRQGAGWMGGWQAYQIPPVLLAILLQSIIAQQKQREQQCYHTHACHAAKSQAHFTPTPTHSPYTSWATTVPAPQIHKL